jgi:protein gp37
MGKDSKIQWCDHTFNFVIGCFPAGEGCKHCYARSLAKRNWADVEWIRGGHRKTMKEKYWNQLERWNKKAKEANETHVVFVNSLSDWLEDHPVVNEERERFIARMADNPNLLFLLLTKRIRNFDKWMSNWNLPHNVAIGISVVTQLEYNRDWPLLYGIGKGLQAPTFISMEPMIEEIEVNTKFLPDQIIIGGESGGTKQARPFDPKWAAKIIEDTKDHDVGIFIKQMGTHWATQNFVPQVGGMFSKSVWKLGDRRGENPDYWKPEYRRFEPIPIPRIDDNGIVTW